MMMFFSMLLLATMAGLSSLRLARNVTLTEEQAALLARVKLPCC